VSAQVSTIVLIAPSVLEAMMILSLA
jgi:hypothetical protein